MLKHSMGAEGLHSGPQSVDLCPCSSNLWCKLLECLRFPVLNDEVSLQTVQLDDELLDSHVISQLGLEGIWHGRAFKRYSSDDIPENAALIGVKLLQAEGATFSLSVGNCYTTRQASQLCRNTRLTSSC